jgi:tetratricopeptide (TPR) repeat protein
VSGVHRYFTWQRAIRGGYLAFTGLGLITAGYTAMRLMGIGPAGTLVAAGKLASSSQLIVADFVNRTSDTTLGPTLTEAMRIDLGQTRIVRILSSTEMGEALQRMEKPPNTVITLPVAREMATREGSKAIVAGEVSAAGRSYLLVARLLDAVDGKELLALRETSPDDAGIVEAIDRLSARLRERIGESLKTIREGVGLARATTSSLEALRLYSEAIRLSANDEDAKAIPLLRQAVAMDTGFAMAWRKLAASLAGNGGKWSEVTDAARRAYQTRDRLTETEAEATKAYYFSNVVRDNARLEAAYRRMLELDPGNEFALPNLAGFYIAQGRCSEAESLLREHSDAPFMQFSLILALTCAGKFAAAHEELARIAALTDSSSPAFLRARSLLLSVISPDSGIEAVKRQQVVVRDPVRLYQAARLLMTMEAARGQLQASDSQVARIEILGRSIGNPLAELGATMEYARMVFAATGDSAATLAMIRAALVRTPLKDHDPADWPAGELAIAYAILGHLAQAKQVLADYEQGASKEFAETDPAYFRARAWIALAENRPADAISEIRRQQAAGTVFDGNYELGLAFEKEGMTDSALASYERAAARVGAQTKYDEDGRVLAVSLRRAGELYEGKGDRAKALDAYGRLVTLWKDADPVLQPQVREVRARMAKLAGEPR